MSKRRHGPNTFQANFDLFYKLKIKAEEQKQKSKQEEPTIFENFSVNWQYLKTGIKNVLKF